MGIGFGIEKGEVEIQLGYPFPWQEWPLGSQEMPAGFEDWNKVVSREERLETCAIYWRSGGGEVEEATAGSLLHVWG